MNEVVSEAYAAGAGVAPARLSRARREPPGLIDQDATLRDRFPDQGVYRAKPVDLQEDEGQFGPFGRFVKWFFELATTAGDKGGGYSHDRARGRGEGEG